MDELKCRCDGGKENQGNKRINDKRSERILINVYWRNIDKEMK